MEKFAGADFLKMQEGNQKADIPLLSMAYLPPVSYFSVLKTAPAAYLEQWENYTKQTYRNRCNILSANGLMSLAVPVEKIKNEKTLVRDVRISDKENWQTQHWRALMSAYNSSPFFEYYIDDLLPFYQKKWQFLLDFNIQLLTKLLELTDLQTKILFTENYQISAESFIDLRNDIHPKKKQQNACFTPYYQVFKERFGFIPDLSLVDLLFNMGNESILFI